MALLISSCAQASEDIIVSSESSEAITELQVLTEQPSVQASRADKRTMHTKSQVLQMYKLAVDNVKLYCPGFTKTVNNELYAAETDENTNLLLNTVMAMLTKDNHAADGILVIDKGDDLACRIHFPVYDTDFGCKIYEGASVKDAICYDNGNSYELVILFQEQSAENGISEEFANMMTPFSDEDLLVNLNAYFPSLNADNCNAKLRYYNCEIRCELDKTVGQVLSLKHKLIAEVTMNVQLDFVFAEPSFTAQATMINHLAFTDFIWNQTALN